MRVSRLIRVMRVMRVIRGTRVIRVNRVTRGVGDLLFYIVVYALPGFSLPIRVAFPHSTFHDLASATGYRKHGQCYHRKLVFSNRSSCAGTR